MKRFRVRAAAAAVIASGAAAVCVSALPASAAAGQAGGPGPVVTDVRTVASFNYAAGQQPENVIISPDGSKIIAMLGVLTGQPPELVRLDPSGLATVFATGQPGDAFSGIALGPDGTIYYAVVSADGSRSGVWDLPPGGSAQRIAAVPGGTLLNDMAIDPAGRTLYVADSLNSEIWAIPASGGTATVWLVSPALAPTQPAPNRFGANGIAFHDGAVWVSNTNQATLLRVPVTATGAPGPIQVVASNLVGIDNFSFLPGSSDVVFAALLGADEVAVVYPDGTSKVVLTASDGLNAPSATAVSGTRLYIADAGDFAPNDAKLQSGHISLAALLAGAKP